ncbi:sugar hydrolase [Paenibacillus helianthi]|nr:sugar hydrolase [Paenibacillus helianthi]
MMSQAIQQSVAVNIKKNEAFAATAERLIPELFYEVCRPQHLIKVIASEEAVHGWRTEVVQSADELPSLALGKGDEVILDFGKHLVGKLSLHIGPDGSPPDAPLFLKVTLGEMPVEMGESFAEYKGWLSRSWLQEETYHLDVLPHTLHMERRYSFRYLKLQVLDTSVKYKVTFDDVSCTTVTSASPEMIVPLKHPDGELARIDEVSIKTLEDCMQEVFEDGPKRDRRLWLGDLRLQALANYETFKNYDLVKRCLYLFAAYPTDKGLISANLFMKPVVIPDDTYLFDYSLFFVASLSDYYEATQDMDTLRELWPTAFRQIELSLERLDTHDIVQDDNSWWAFIDWKDQLSKVASAQAILIYNMKSALQLATILEDHNQEFLQLRIEQLTAAALQFLWSDKLHYFVSGEQQQISWASQIWMILAGVIDEAKGKELLVRLLEEKPGLSLSTPYMMHHLIEALIQVGERERATLEIKKYWGQMVKDGADTFWELYDPENKNFSPYGSYLINSYCHAWSCTPSYFIRKYHL